MTTDATTTAVAPDSDRDLLLTRIFDAPPEKVYRAWTDPEVLKQWFAPRPYITPVAELDVRPGGTGLIVMRGPDGTDSPARASILRSCRTADWSAPTSSPKPGSRRPSRS